MSFESSDCPKQVHRNWAPAFAGDQERQLSRTEYAIAKQRTHIPAPIRYKKHEHRGIEYAIDYPVRRYEKLAVIAVSHLLKFARNAAPERKLSE